MCFPPLFCSGKTGVFSLFSCVHFFSLVPGQCTQECIYRGTKRFRFPPPQLLPQKYFFPLRKVRIHPHPSLFIPLFSANQKKGGVKEQWIENSKAPRPFLLHGGGKKPIISLSFPTKKRRVKSEIYFGDKNEGKRPRKKAKKFNSLPSNFSNFDRWNCGSGKSGVGRVAEVLRKSGEGPPFLSSLFPILGVGGEREALKKINLLAQFTRRWNPIFATKKVNVFPLIILRFLRKKGNVFLISSSQNGRIPLLPPPPREIKRP